MTPYYAHGGITIYHGDCREILPDVWLGVDLLLTDPPYGINIVKKDGKIGSSKNASCGVYAPAHDDDKPFDPSHLMAFPRRVLWGGNHYADKLPPSAGWLIWDKLDGGTPADFAEAELAWTNVVNRVRMFRHKWRGMIRASETDKRFHPTQKPVALMQWVIQQWTQTGQLVLDPYMGSGPVLIAAKESTRRAIGIEIEERYCEIAAKRLAQEVLPLEVGA